MQNVTTEIIIVDDHPLFRKGVSQLLAMDPALRAVGEAQSGEEALNLAREHDPDLILLDLNMRGMDGIATIRALREADVQARIVVLTVSDNDEDVVSALRAGADGYLLKDMEPEALLARIKEAATGRMVLSESLTQVLAEAVSGHRTNDESELLRALTSRELEVLKGLSKGMSNKLIARKYDIAEGTVKVHVKNVLRKLNLRSRVEAAVWAVNHGVR